MALKFQQEIHPQVRLQVCCAFSVMSLANKMKILTESENGLQISNTSATHGEVTILIFT